MIRKTRNARQCHTCGVILGDESWTHNGRYLCLRHYAIEQSDRADKAEHNAREWSQKLDELKHTKCMADGKHCAENSPTMRCDHHNAETWKGYHEEERARNVELWNALGFANKFGDSAPDVRDVQTWALSRIAEPSAVANIIVPSGHMISLYRVIEYTPAQVKLSASQEAFCDATRRLLAKRVESGPGLALRYPDATPAAKPIQDTITCDVGADWDD